MRIRWLKAMFGLRPGEQHVAVTLNARARLIQMGEQLAGTHDLVAIYVPEGTDEVYNVGASRGRVVGAVRLLPLPPNKSVEDYPIHDWDQTDANPAWRGEARWPIGWPSQTVLYGEPDQFPVLRSLVQAAHGAAAFGSYTNQFQSGPVRLDPKMQTVIQRAMVRLFGEPPWPDVHVD